MFAKDFGVSIFRVVKIEMKSESGVNPEQTRCCKLYTKSLNVAQIHCSIIRMGR